VPAAPDYPLLGRGVKVAPYLSKKGHGVLIAIDRFGRVVDHTLLLPGVDRIRAADALEQRLDRLDPPIQLVRDDPARRIHHPAPREIDPRLYSDPRSPLAKRRYLNGLVKHAASKLPRRPSDLS
jgi:hypothetical protein